MKTANQVLSELKNDPSRAKAMRKIINQGHGDAFIAKYEGVPYSVHKCSNAYKTKALWEARGYKIVAEEAGARRQYASEGYIVYLALIRVGR